MKVLFIGDSITRGSQGVDWVKLIEDAHPYWTIKNAGANGETLNAITGRLKKQIESDPSFDVVVLQTGTNDILLPLFKHRGFWFQRAYNYQLKSGNQPAAPQQFEILLTNAVDFIRKNTNAQIVLPTVGCINENLLAETNAKLFSYNSIIRNLAKSPACILAEISEKFQQELGKTQTHDYCLENFSNTAIIDLITSSLGFEDNLSQRRKLHLTIDGVHLNRQGAQIYKNVVEQAILLAKEKSLLFI